MNFISKTFLYLFFLPVLGFGFIFPAAAISAKAKILRDLPPLISQLIATRSLLQTLAKAQFQLTEIWLDEPNLLEMVRRQLQTVNKISGHYSNVFTPPSFDVPVGSHEKPISSFDRVSLADLRKIAEKIKSIEEKINQMEVCKDLKIKSNPEAHLKIERHNFIVLFTRNFHGICGQPVTWRPTGIDNQNRKLFSIFTFPNSMFSKSDLWARLHRYLTVPQNYPFMRKFKLMTAIYFYYLQLTFDARVLTLVSSEFIVRRRDLYDRYPEIEVLRGQIAAGFSFKLWN